MIYQLCSLDNTVKEPSALLRREKSNSLALNEPFLSAYSSSPSSFQLSLKDVNSDSEVNLTIFDSIFSSCAIQVFNAASTFVAFHGFSSLMSTSSHANILLAIISLKDSILACPRTGVHHGVSNRRHSTRFWTRQDSHRFPVRNCKEI